MLRLLRCPVTRHNVATLHPSHYPIRPCGSMWPVRQSDRRGDIGNRKATELVIRLELGCICKATSMMPPFYSKRDRPSLCTTAVTKAGTTLDYHRDDGVQHVCRDRIVAISP